MIQQDTVKLLRECDAGIKMGVDSSEDVMKYVKGEPLRKCLAECRREHEVLREEVQTLLDKYHDEGKDPNLLITGMSWMKTEMKLNMEDSDKTVADLMTDGCNMGVKSLSKYLNKYEAADEVSKDIAKRLIHLEAQLATDIRRYL